MPKEYINYPSPIQIESSDGMTGERLPAPPQVGIHWDGSHEIVQLSLDIDWGVLQEIVDTRRNNPEGWYGEAEDRAIFYTVGLSRPDLQRLIKHTRRARDAVFGSDE